MLKRKAILKRLLKVSHPLLLLYTLKVIKSQVPYCGRKWRQCTFFCFAVVSFQAEVLLSSQHEGDYLDLPELSTRPARRMAHRC